MWEDSLSMQDRSRSKARAGRLETVLVLSTWREVGISKVQSQWTGQQTTSGGLEEREVA